MPSVLWRCWLGGRKGIRPVKNFEWWGAGVVIWLERVEDLHTAQLMPLPFTVSCFSKIQIGFTFLVPAHLGSPGQRAVKRVCVSLFLMPSCLMTLNECFMFNALMLWHYWLGVRKGIWTCIYSPADATATHTLSSSVKSRLVVCAYFYCFYYW